jgi:two-component system cell cycle sensor histidine kinase/response regulator CckA
LPRISILQLEDSVLDSDLELAQLTRAGIEFEARRVETREDFVLALERSSFDVILADFHLPNFNGLDALAIARVKAPATPFIFVSGMLGEEIAIDSLKNGATDYVLKMRMERLAPSITRALGEVNERRERRRAESVLQETENRFRNMAESAPVMIWTAGEDKRWSYCNRPWLEFTGLSLEASSGAGWASLVHADDRSRVLEAYIQAFEKREGFSSDFRLLRRDGEFRWLACRASARFDMAGGFAGLIGSSVDITEVKQTEERLRHAAKLESLGILAGGIAHDFNNLLTGIMGNASLILEDLPPDSRSIPFAENIVQASETAAQLTRQMLAYSGKGRFVLERIDLSKEVRDITPLIEASIPRMVALKLHLARPLPLVEADPAQIQQLVMNLVINGAEAISGSGGTVTVSTDLSNLDGGAAGAMLSGFSIPEGKYVTLRVRDTGCGMDVQTRTRIFDPFFTTKFTGRGLGLAAVSGIVRGHRAGLFVESAPGCGTEFVIYFPVAVGDADPDREEMPAFAQPGSGTILVVDDEPVVSRTARLALQRYGYTVLTAHNGREAVDLFRAVSSEIDLVLLDMTLPVMSGEVAFQALRAIRPDVRVLATSGYSEVEALSRFGAEIDGFIQKPYKAATLAEKVHAILTRPFASP